jgi:predicted dehydrogenase
MWTEDQWSYIVRPAPHGRRDRPVRWVIVGTGGIAAAFAADLRVEPKARELLAVASRGSDRRRRAPWAPGQAYGSHEQLAADPEYDPTSRMFDPAVSG